MATKQAYKICPSCKREYTEEEWKALPLVGTMGDDEVVLELRNCPCKSTIATYIKGEPSDD